MIRICVLQLYDPHVTTLRVQGSEQFGDQTSDDDRTNLFDELPESRCIVLVVQGRTEETQIFQSCDPVLQTISIFFPEIISRAGATSTHGQARSGSRSEEIYLPTSRKQIRSAATIGFIPVTFLFCLFFINHTESGLH
jgi:hypothetical protein